MKNLVVKKNKLYGPFLWMGFNCLNARATSRRQFIFYHKVPRNFWYSFYQPQKDERLSWPWSHPLVLKTRPLNWECSVLTTRPLLHYFIVGRRLLTPLCYEDPLYFLTIFLEFCLNPLSPLLPLLLFLLPCFFDWMGDRTASDVLFLT